MPDLKITADLINKVEKMFGTKPRNPERISKVLKAVEKLWKKFPDRRLTQLVATIANTGETFPKLFHMEDEVFKNNAEYAFREHQFYKRKAKENLKFRFTKKNIERLDMINKLLAEKEQQAWVEAKHLENYFMEESKKGKPFFSDYEIMFQFDFFVEDDFKDEYDMGQKVNKNPYYTDMWGMRFLKKMPGNENEVVESETWLKANHNEFQHHEHPLKQQYHCWTFHNLYHHTVLGWTDIIRLNVIYANVIFHIINKTELVKTKIK